MRRLALFCLFVWFPPRLGAAEDPTAALDGVQDLTPETFDAVINGRVHALVEFYAPWCGHCKALTPAFKSLGAKALDDPKLKGRVVIAKVNADTHRGLGSRFSVTGFPTLKWFSRGQPVDAPEESYRGKRSFEQLLEFIEKKLEADKGFGRIDVLDAIVKGFLTGDKDDVIFKTQAAVAALSDEEDQAKGALYLRLMRKAKEKGDDYLATERARVQRILDSGSLHQDKVQELSRKVSVISAFLPEP